MRSCFQWLFHPECDVLNFPPSLPGDTIGVGGDGNPQYLPDHRRMWVSGKVVLEKPFFANDRVEKTTRVSSVTEKSTRQGKVYFVERESHMNAPISGGHFSETTTHAFLQPRERAAINDSVLSSTVIDEDPFRPLDARVPTSTTLLFAETVDVDSPLLFRYSALTYNSHKIHYDRDYATSTEGYSGLVIHGPLIASFLLDAYQNYCHTKSNKSLDPFSGYAFSYRGKAPICLDSKIHLVAWQSGPRQGDVVMAARNEKGVTAMEASVTRTL